MILIVPNIQYDVKIDENIIKNNQEPTSVILYKIPVFRIPRKIASVLTFFYLFIKGLQLGRDVDIIFCQFQPHHFVFVVGFLLGKILRKPVVARADDVSREMGEDPRYLSTITRKRRQIFNIFNEFFIKYVNSFLVVCSEHREILEARLGKLNNIQLSYNGVNPDECIKACGEELRQYLNIESNKRVILFIGRFSGPEYRIEILFEAFSIIQTAIPNSLLLLIGDVLPKKLVKKLENNTNNIRIIGPTIRSEIMKYVSIADVCIGPLGVTRTIPLKVLEYMACEKPIVTGLGSVSKDVAVNGYNCLCVAPEPHYVAEAIVQILKNEDVARFLSVNARNTALKYSWDHIALDILTILKENIPKK